MTLDTAINLAQQPADALDMPVLAKVAGKAWSELPPDLFIPPEAMQVFLEAFEGPLDLLLYLIKRQNLDILDIPMVKICRQYGQYVELMQEFNVVLAADYLVMAAMLAEIKSRLLLPRPVVEDENADEEDPRAELVRRLQEYERFKTAASHIDALPREIRDWQRTCVDLPEAPVATTFPDVDMDAILMALRDVMARAKNNKQHTIEFEPLSLRERMSDIIAKLQTQEFLPFHALFRAKEGRIGVAVTFIAMLELSRQSVLEFVQSEAFAPIHVRTKGDVDHAPESH